MNEQDKERWFKIGLAAILCSQAVFQWKTHTSVQAVRAEVHTVETQTNHIKDQLVAATALASHAEGKAEGKQEGVDTAKELLNSNKKHNP